MPNYQCILNDGLFYWIFCWIYIVPLWMSKQLQITRIHGLWHSQSKAVEKCLGAKLFKLNRTIQSSFIQTYPNQRIKTQMASSPTCTFIKFKRKKFPRDGHSPEVVHNAIVMTQCRLFFQQRHRSSLKQGKRITLHSTLHRIFMWMINIVHLSLKW